MEALCQLDAGRGETIPKPRRFLPLDGSSSPELKPSIEKPPSLELKPLPSYLKYVFLENDSSLPIIVSSNLTELQEKKLKRVLKEHMTAIGWSIVDIKGISPVTCTHKILMRRDTAESTTTATTKPQYARGELTVVANDNNVLIPTRTVIGWRVCIDYRALNEAARKYHFPLPFIDQMGEKLAGHGITISLMVTLATSKWLFPLRIKRKLHSLAHTEFDLEIRDRKGSENIVADHLSRIDKGYMEDMHDFLLRNEFPNEHLYAINAKGEPWFANFANFLAGISYCFQDTNCEQRKLQLNELAEIRHQAMRMPEFLSNAPKHGMMHVCNPKGAVELLGEKGPFKVNGHRLKQYLEGTQPPPVEYPILLSYPCGSHRQANDVKKALHGRQPMLSFMFYFMFSALSIVPESQLMLQGSLLKLLFCVLSIVRDSRVVLQGSLLKLFSMESTGPSHSRCRLSKTSVTLPLTDIDLYGHLQFWSQQHQERYSSISQLTILPGTPQPLDIAALSHMDLLTKQHGILYFAPPGEVGTRLGRHQREVSP
ncbi:hypothetical protein Sango_1596100 [Sesamum angolense]|uniref:Uncharacterized protein n=1 Tax=Sesamum angolense TaxID=2727404 RepID=A0AAE2BU28_9LAMI|nr:hypothetical protein Sango_1596100 [Sesamum angolense]